MAFALDGRAYEIDLSADIAHGAARRVRAVGSRRRKVGAAKRVIDLRTRGSRRAEDTAAIRAAAVENGIPVSAQGADL